MQVRYPLGLRNVGEPGVRTFAALFAIESLARALLATVIAVQALELLGNARNVSAAYSLVGLIGLSASLGIPYLVRSVGRRWVYTIGIGALVTAAMLLNRVDVAGQIAGMQLRVFGTACLNITTSLYIMQYIRKRELTRAEPFRLQMSAAAWTIGPATGMLLYQRLGPQWAFGASAAAALVLLAIFWYLRLAERTPIAPATRAVPTPFRYVARFLAQPRLRLAWLITFGRSSWWTFFFIYAPLYMVQQGPGATAGALLVSAGNATLFLTPVAGRLAMRHGIRRVITGALLICAVATFTAAFVLSTPAVVVVLLLIGSFACMALDAIGNIPFMRAVRVHERAEMTTVFRTYLDFAELLPPAVFAVLLSFTGLPAVFVAMGSLVLAVVAFARFLPRSM